MVAVIAGQASQGDRLPDVLLMGIGWCHDRLRVGASPLRTAPPTAFLLPTAGTPPAPATGARAPRSSRPSPAPSPASGGSEARGGRPRDRAPGTGPWPSAAPLPWDTGGVRPCVGSP